MKRIRRRNPGLSRIKTGPGRSAMCVDPVTPGCQLLPYSLFCFEYQCSFCLPLCYSVFYPWEGKKSRVRIEKLIKFQQTFWKILLKTVLNLQSLDLAGVELLQPFLCDRCQLLSFAGLMIQVFMGSSQHQLDPVQLVYLAGSGIIVHGNDVGFRMLAAQLLDDALSNDMVGRRRCSWCRP